MTLNRAPTFLKNRIAALRANKKQVVETGWTFNSAPAVAVEPVPAPVSSAPAGVQGIRHLVRRCGIYFILPTPSSADASFPAYCPVMSPYRTCPISARLLAI